MLPLELPPWDLVLRGAVAAVLMLHLLNLVWPGAQPAVRLPVRLTLAGFVASVMAYLACQQAHVLLHLPRPLAYGLLALCVCGAAWLWLAARALFDDHFRWGWLEAGVLGGVLLIGLAANLPYFPDGEGVFKTWAPDSPVVWIGHVHTIALLACSAAAAVEVARGWRSDLVEARRATRRWVALGIVLYAVVALLIEVAVRGQTVGPWLPALHVLGIGAIATALALQVLRRPLADVLGLPGAAPAAAAQVGTQETPMPMTAPLAVPTDPPPTDRQGRALARLEAALTQAHVYRQEGLTLAGLAQTLEMSEATLRELINQRLGFRNFNDFLHHHRLHEAVDRLAREDLPVLSIALACGYGSIGPFNRAFKQRLGMTPTEYRAGQRLARASARG